MHAYAKETTARTDRQIRTEQGLHNNENLEPEAQGITSLLRPLAEVTSALLARPAACRMI